jgi:hypothetical protein
METKQFHLRDLLTIVTGRLLMLPDKDKSAVEGVYDFLEWMTGGMPYTHQLPRFIRECKPYLLKWFPELSIALASESLGTLKTWLDSDQTPDKREGIRMWLAELKMMQPQIKDNYDVPQMPPDDHDRIDPYLELLDMANRDHHP